METKSSYLLWNMIKKQPKLVRFVIFIKLDLIQCASVCELVWVEHFKLFFMGNLSNNISNKWLMFLWRNAQISIWTRTNMNSFWLFISYNYISSKYYTLLRCWVFKNFFSMWIVTVHTYDSSTIFMSLYCFWNHVLLALIFF